MIPGAISTVTHGLCKNCGKGGFLADELCRGCIQRRAEVEHFAPATVDKLEARPRVVKIKKRWS